LFAHERKRIRSVKKLMRCGKQEVLQVLRVDEEKGYVDLSKKLLMPKDIENCSERFEKAKIVNGILRRLAEMRKVAVRELYEQFGWGLFEGEGVLCFVVLFGLDLIFFFFSDGHAYDVLQNAQLDTALLTKYKVPAELQADLLGIGKQKKNKSLLQFSQFVTACPTTPSSARLRSI
jgi:hypothetical protein